MGIKQVISPLKAAQATERLFNAFKSAHQGREPDTVEELDEWIETDEGQEVIAATPWPSTQ